MEINYTMKGSRQTYLPHASDSSQYKFNIQWDYIEVPISISVHDKKLVMFSLGIAPAFMIRYKQRSENGQNETDNPPSGQPSRFDLSVFGMLNFVIQKHYALGIKYGYSTIPIRSSSGYGFSKIRGQYNNVLTLRFTYIMDSVKKKKK
ncbi:MAG: hypothetical protein IPP77_12930 [Bacteroidetes bacterium]|nr:hypothetical protein [Bacteroidota bacterium]